MWNLNFTTYCHQPKHNICVYNIIWNKISYRITKWDIIFENKFCYIMEVNGTFLQNLLFGAYKTQFSESPSPPFITKMWVNVTGFFWPTNLPNIIIVGKNLRNKFDEFRYKNSSSGVPIRTKYKSSFSKTKRVLKKDWYPIYYPGSWSYNDGYLNI